MATLILGSAVATVGQMTSYIKKINPDIPQSVIDMIPIYIEEGEIEGVRGDIAFAQSCLETGNFNFKGSAVTLDQNNFCGMGVTSNGMKGNSFDTPRLGIRGQIQHLKAYATSEPLKQPCVDPRYIYVEKGSAIYVEWLGIQENPRHYGWAAGAHYGEKILEILGRILAIEVKIEPKIDPEPAPKPIQIALEIGQTATLQTRLRVRKGPGTSYKQKHHAELTKDGKKHDSTKTGCLDKGTRVTVLEVRFNDMDIWVRCPSGWLAAYYQGNTYIK